MRKSYMQISVTLLLLHFQTLIHTVHNRIVWGYNSYSEPGRESAWAWFPSATLICPRWFPQKCWLSHKGFTYTSSMGTQGIGFDKRSWIPTEWFNNFTERCTIMVSQESNLVPNLEIQRQLQSWRMSNWLTKIQWNFFWCKSKFCALDMGSIQFL
jgi:hypothetical protein